MEYKKVEVFVPDDSKPHLCRITTNDYQTQIEWLESIEEIIRDEALEKYPIFKGFTTEGFPHEIYTGQQYKREAYIAGRSKSIESEKQKDERIKQLEEFLRRHEQWEASVISDDSMWWPNTEKDALNGKIYDSFLELQGLRNKLLGKYIDGKCSHSYRYYQDKKVCHSCGHTVYGDFRE